MGKWILIFYMAGHFGNHGGPGVVYFETEEACKQTFHKMTKQWPHRLTGLCTSRE